jgi:hypothetical protein
MGAPFCEAWPSHVANTQLRERLDLLRLWGINAPTSASSSSSSTNSVASTLAANDNTTTSSALPILSSPQVIASTSNLADSIMKRKSKNSRISGSSTFKSLSRLSSPSSTWQDRKTPNGKRYDRDPSGDPKRLMYPRRPVARYLPPSTLIPSRPAPTGAMQIMLLGMHHSGTSLLGGLLSRTGVNISIGNHPPYHFLPDMPILIDEQSNTTLNPRGYWENGDMWNLNDDILRSHVRPHNTNQILE